MNWDAISGVAEIISAVGVIFSLLYVGFQIKKHTVETRRANARATAHDHAAAITVLANDPEIAEIILNGFADLDRFENFTPVERYRFDLATLIWLQAIEQAFADIRQRNYPDDMEDTYRVMVPGVLNTLSGRIWWKQRKAWFSANFQKEVESLLDAPPGESIFAGTSPRPNMPVS